MFEINVSFFSILEDIVGKSDVKIKLEGGSKIIDLLKELIKEFGEEFQKNILDSKGDVNKYVILGINGRDIRTIAGLETSIHKDDDIVFLPAIAGG